MKTIDDKPMTTAERQKKYRELHPENDSFYGMIGQHNIRSTIGFRQED
jgi:hypothetical protein